MLWATFETTFPKEKASKCNTAGHSTSGQQFASYSAEKRAIAIGCCLGPTIVFNGCRFKSLTKLPPKSDRSDTEVGERRQSRTLRRGKRVQRGKA